MSRVEACRAWNERFYSPGLRMREEWSTNEYRESSMWNCRSFREMLGKFSGRVYLEIAILGTSIRYRNKDIKLSYLVCWLNI